MSSSQNETKKTEAKKPFELTVQHSIELCRDISKFVNNKQESDLVIKCGEKTLNAHKIILACRSSKLFDMMSNLKSNELIVDDVSYENMLVLLQYIYGATVQLNQDSIYDIVTAAEKFGLEDLKIACFEFIVKNLNKDAVIPLLMKAQAKEFHFDATSLIDKCLQFIEQRMSDIITSKDFLLFEEDTMIKLIKNDNIIVEEYDLFLAVLNWAKHRCKENYSDLAKIMEKFIPYIRFPSMEPNILYSKIKKHVYHKTPSEDKFIPLEYYMKAMEYHVYPDAFAMSKDIQFKERFKRFEDSKILSISQAEILSKWLNTPDKVWKCLYRASRDGFGAVNFHSRCDNYGPTVVIIKSESGAIFGGYTPLKWASNNRYQYDSNTFLFRLKSANKDENDTPVKLLNNASNKNSIYCGANYGPTFGGGHDLYVCNNSNTVNSSYTNTGYSFTVPGHAYNSAGARSFLAGTYNFRTVEIEVYH